MDPKIQLSQLLTYPKEDIHIEIKSWLDPTNNEDKARLAKALLALANSGGGFLIIGLEESKQDGFIPKPPPIDIEYYSQDQINGIVEKYASPLFHCKVDLIKHPDNDHRYPIITVPKNLKVPVRCRKHGPEEKIVKQNAYYIRRPGPRSATPKSGQEWERLIRRCIFASKEELLNNFRDIMSEESSEETQISIEDATRNELEEWFRESKASWKGRVAQNDLANFKERYGNGTWSVAYTIIENDGAEIDNLHKLLEILKRVEGNETGWPPWLVPPKGDFYPIPIENNIECWIKDTNPSDGAHSDFWRASLQGKLFLLRGYEDDSLPDRLEPGKFLDITLPIWRIGECLLHAKRFVKCVLEKESKILFKVNWEGLKGRKLSVWASKNRILLQERICHQDSIEETLVIESSKIETVLPEIVANLTRKLYQAFDFYDLPSKLISKEIDNLKKSK